MRLIVLGVFLLCILIAGVVTTTIVLAATGTDTSEFYTQGEGRCVISKDETILPEGFEMAVPKVYWEDKDGIRHDTTLEEGYCSLATTGIWQETGCCPRGYTCEGLPPNDICKVDLGYVEQCGNIFSCDDYTNKQDCEADPCSVAYQGVGSEYCVASSASIECTNPPQIRYTISECACKWDDTTGKCYLEKNISQQIAPGTSSLNTATCKFEVASKSECVDGVMSVELKGTLIGSISPVTEDGETPDCANIQNVFCPPTQTKQYACGMKTAMLPFFTISNIFASIVCIALLSAILRKFRKRENL